MEIVAAAIAGYLLGSIPFGLIMTRLNGGVDLRDYGSGKTGFTNSLRVLGLRRSLPVFIGDFLKGVVAAALPLAWTDDPWAQAAGGLAAVCGHVWPIFARFRGGRGVLTGLGVLVFLNPLAVLAVAPLAAIVLKTTRYMSLTSISGAALAACLFVAFAAIDEHPWAYAVAACIGGALIIALHHDNIARLRAGTERRVGERVETA
ncbi:MAG TPA: glycerol-3-phosphate 1-O-acyltransferase PlsY [Dehalococcoidia bacterium]|jgi:glycerol-3-phosphate acyltransferase PlsY|nr:glycerol-3-phosphate 1-O-acyltransferase PlsY [Dehalococcoidia bacterium]